MDPHNRPTEEEEKKKPHSEEAWRHTGTQRMDEAGSPALMIGLLSPCLDDA
jgi:hypothetical protein